MRQNSRGYDSYSMISQPTPGERRINQPTRVLVNFTKCMKKHSFCSARFSIIIWNYKKKFPLHPAPIQKFNEIYIYIFTNNVDREMCTTVFSVSFVFGSNPKQIISLQSSYFLLCLVPHQSKTAEESVHDHLYHEEASWYLDICLKQFNKTFIVLKVSAHNNI